MDITASKSIRSLLRHKAAPSQLVFISSWFFLITWTIWNWIMTILSTSKASQLMCNSLRRTLLQKKSPEQKGSWHPWLCMLSKKCSVPWIRSWYWGPSHLFEQWHYWQRLRYKYETREKTVDRHVMQSLLRFIQFGFVRYSRTLKNDLENLAQVNTSHRANDYFLLNNFRPVKYSVIKNNTNSLCTLWMRNKNSWNISDH